MIRERQREGISAAQRRGAYRGRKRSLTAAQVAELLRRGAAGEPKTTLAREFGISRETVYQYLRASRNGPPSGEDRVSTTRSAEPAGTAELTVVCVRALTVASDEG
ncbi:MAG: helix-turn-helix domain-containing protein [Pseudonocardiaceae bacterium]